MQKKTEGCGAPGQRRSDSEMTTESHYRLELRGRGKIERTAGIIWRSFTSVCRAEFLRLAILQCSNNTLPVSSSIRPLAGADPSAPSTEQGTEGDGQARVKEGSKCSAITATCGKEQQKTFQAK